MSKGMHELAYGYLLNHVFEYYGVKLGKRIARTIKQALSHITLIVCENGELKARTRKSPMSELIDQKEAIEELTTALAKKNAKVIFLKDKLAQGTSED